MLKFATASLLVFAIITVSLTLPISAQQQVPAKESESTNASQPAQPDLNEVFAKETARIKADAAVFDPIKTDRENANQQAQKKGWSTTKKVVVISAIAVGFAALLFLVIKYGKECIRSTPENCNPVVDDNCVCHEYERRVQN